MRTGRTTDSVAPPYRARWIWCGPNLTLRNQDSHTGWTNNLQAREGYSLGEQERKVRAYCEREGIELVEVFVESGVSLRSHDAAETSALDAIFRWKSSQAPSKVYV